MTDCDIEIDVSFEIVCTQFRWNNVNLINWMRTFLVSDERANEDSNWNNLNVDRRIFLMLNFKVCER